MSDEFWRKAPPPDCGISPAGWAPLPDNTKRSYWGLPPRGPDTSETEKFYRLHDEVNRKLTDDMADAMAYTFAFDPVGKDIKAEIADEAKRIVSGARRSAYGTPENNFERIARFWQAYFENTGRPEAKITAADVSPLMRLMKEARLCETPDHKDSFIDIIGYALTGAEVNGVKTQE